MKKLPREMNVAAGRAVAAARSALENAENARRDAMQNATRYAKLRARVVSVQGEGAPVTGQELDDLVDGLP